MFYSDLRSSYRYKHFLACMYVHLVHAGFLYKSEAGIGFLGSRVVDHYKGPCGCWERNLGIPQVYAQFTGSKRPNLPSQPYSALPLFLNNVFVVNGGYFR